MLTACVLSVDNANSLKVSQSSSAKIRHLSVLRATTSPPPTCRTSKVKRGKADKNDSRWNRNRPCNRGCAEVMMLVDDMDAETFKRTHVWKRRCQCRQRRQSRGRWQSRGCCCGTSALLESTAPLTFLMCPQQYRIFDTIIRASTRTVHATPLLLLHRPSQAPIQEFMITIK